MSSNKNPPFAIDPKSKKIRKTKISQPSKSNQKRLNLQSSLKICILLDIKKCLIQITQADFNPEDLDEDKCLDLLEKVKLDDYNKSLEGILSKHVIKDFYCFNTLADFFF